MIDVSDGLALDLHRLADQSGIGFELDDVPVAEGATLDEALGGGEDYELVMAIGPDDLGRLDAAFDEAGLVAPLRLGLATADPQTRLLAGEPLGHLGFQHWALGQQGEGQREAGSCPPAWSTAVHRPPGVDQPGPRGQHRPVMLGQPGDVQTLAHQRGEDFAQAVVPLVATHMLDGSGLVGVGLVCRHSRRARLLRSSCGPCGPRSPHRGPRPAGARRGGRADPPGDSSGAIAAGPPLDAWEPTQAPRLIVDDSKVAPPSAVGASSTLAQTKRARSASPARCAIFPAASTAVGEKSRPVTVAPARAKAKVSRPK